MEIVLAALSITTPSGKNEKKFAADNINDDAPATSYLNGT